MDSILIKNVMSNVIIGQEAVEGMMRGIKLATDVIRPTYGPKGTNVVIEHEFRPFHQVANDAQTIVQAIETEHPIEKRGLGFLKELMEKADKDSGDGRKTTAIIAEEILRGAIESGLSGIQLKRELDALIPVIESAINRQKVDITENEISKIAANAGESESLGKILQEIYQHIGRDGIIIPEGSGTYETSYVFIDGVRFAGTGYLSPYMVHDEVAVKEGRKETQAIYENPLILVTKNKISHFRDINPLLDRLNSNDFIEKFGKKDLVIFTDDMDSTVASVMIKAHLDKIFNILIIKAPVLWKQYVFEDFAKVTGATIIEDASGLNFKNLELKHLGTCGTITVDKDETIITGTADIHDHLSMLKAEGTVDSKLRLSWLITKTAILRLGANNESELSYLRLKCHDAINASRLALRDGVVEGGGAALTYVAAFLHDSDVEKILSDALVAPFKQNLKNMRLDKKNWGDEIIDAAAVIKNAVRNAISLASTVLTCGAVITLVPKKQLADQPKERFNF